jgi:hypothetical protein
MQIKLKMHQPSPSNYWPVPLHSIQPFFLIYVEWRQLLKIMSDFV